MKPKFQPKRFRDFETFEAQPPEATTPPLRPCSSLMAGLPRRVLLSVVTSAVLHQAMQVFGEAVETLCRASSQPELSSELQLLKASVALGRYVKNNSPQLKSKVAGAMATFLNTRLVGWVRDQGGWVSDHLPV